MRKSIDIDRRRLLQLAAISAAAAPFAHAPAAASEPFGTLKHIDAGPLNVGYVEAGRADGPVALLLHGWPYDIHSFIDVVPVLVAGGYRVIVPYLRGYGTTRFLAADSVRNGQQAALGFDAIALLDALKIKQAVVGGFDWGARTACIVAALWPARCRALVSVSGYLIGSQEANRAPLPPKAELQWWYQFYFATERGEAGYGKYRREFARLIWELASPKWSFDDATFERSASAFDNPDHVAISIHNYRWRLGLAAGEAAYDATEKQLAALPAIGVPHDHTRRRREWCPAPAARRVRRQVHRCIRTSGRRRRRWPQPAAGSATRVCAGGH